MRGYLKLNAEALYRPLWRTRFGRSYGPVVRGWIFICLSVLISLERWIPSIESRFFLSIFIILFMIYNSSPSVPFCIKFWFILQRSSLRGIFLLKVFVVLGQYNLTLCIWHFNCIVYDCYRLLLHDSVRPGKKYRLFGGIYYPIFHSKYGAIFFSATSTDFFPYYTASHWRGK